MLKLNTNITLFLNYICIFLYLGIDCLEFSNIFNTILYSVFITSPIKMFATYNSHRLSFFFFCNHLISEEKAGFYTKIVILLLDVCVLMYQPGGALC